MAGLMKKRQADRCGARSDVPWTTDGRRDNRRQFRAALREVAARYLNQMHGLTG
jgi:hypothetical protein